MSHPDDAAYVVLLDDDVSELRGVHVRLQEKLEKYVILAIDKLSILHI